VCSSDLESIQIGLENKQPVKTNAAAETAPRIPELIPEIADHIRAQIQNGGNEIRIQLKPEALGRIEIHAENGAQGVTARILVETAAVKNYLENNLQMLQQNLQDQGLKVAHIDFLLQDGFGSQFFSRQQQPGEAANERQNNHARRNVSDSNLSSAANGTSFESGTIRSLGPNNTFHTIV
jgi:flagellar hook-length control protein FliK